MSNICVVPYRMERDFNNQDCKSSSYLWLEEKFTLIKDLKKQVSNLLFVENIQWLSSCYYFTI